MHAYVLSAEEQKGGIMMMTRTTGGPLKIWMWKLAKRMSFPAPGDYLELETDDLEAANRELNQYKSISLDSKYDNKPVNYSWRRLEEGDVPREARNKINRDRTPQLKAAKTLLQNPSRWKDKNLHKFLMDFVGENEKRFFNAPAAVGNHHAWRGGLLVHTAEVVANCMGVLDSPMNEFYMEDIDGDALLLAAWFHDMGKIETYRMDGDRPTIDGQKESRIGHVVLGHQIFRDAALKASIDPETVELVCHCILSHHEHKDWGSPVTPDCREAQILCRADNISSKISD